MTRLKDCWKKKASRLSWQAVSLGALLLSLNASAAIYEYRDERGKRIFVDSLSKVPHQFRDQFETREAVVQTEQESAESDRLNRIAELERALRNIDKVMAQQASTIHAQNNQILVPVRVARGNRSQELRLLLDTGANRTVFHSSALSRIGTVGSAVGQAQTASGQQINLYSMNLDRFEIGPFEISPAQVQVIDYQGDAQHQGLLGMDILSQIEYDLDIEKEELRWAPEQFEQLKAQRVEIEAALALLRSPPSEQLAPVPSEISIDGKAE